MRLLVIKTHPYLKQKLLAYRTIAPNLSTKRTSCTKICLEQVDFTFTQGNEF